MSDYWRICVEEALEEAGVSATEEQISSIASVMEAARSEYGEQHGHVEADRSLWVQQNREIERLRNQVEEETAKVPCPECEGKWAPGLGGTTEPARYSCWKCDATGKVAPHLGRQ